MAKCSVVCMGGWCAGWWWMVWGVGVGRLRFVCGHRWVVGWWIGGGRVGCTNGRLGCVVMVGGWLDVWWLHWCVGGCVGV